MTSRLNATNQTRTHSEPIVAKSLSELPKEDRRKITTELMRIHNLVNALENEFPRDTKSDKADTRRLA